MTHDTLDSRLARELMAAARDTPAYEYHVVTIGAQHDPSDQRVIQLAIIEDSAAVLEAHGEGDESAWQGWADEMVEWASERTMQVVEGLPAAVVETTVRYEPDGDERLTFDFSHAAVDVELEIDE